MDERRDENDGASGSPLLRGALPGPVLLHRVGAGVLGVVRRPVRVAVLRLLRVQFHLRGQMAASPGRGATGCGAGSAWARLLRIASRGRRRAALACSGGSRGFAASFLLLAGGGAGRLEWPIRAPPRSLNGKNTGGSSMYVHMDCDVSRSWEINAALKTLKNIDTSHIRRKMCAPAYSIGANRN